MAFRQAAVGPGTLKPLSYVATTLAGGLVMKFAYLFFSVLLIAPGAALAQHADSRCPSLPASSGLQWEEKANTGFLACKARNDDGSKSINLLLTSRDPDLQLRRSRRAESGVFSGESLHWYVPELAGRDEAYVASRRITVRAPGWFCTTAASASPSQLPTTLMSVTPSSSGPLAAEDGADIKVTEPSSI